MNSPPSQPLPHSSVFASLRWDAFAVALLLAIGLLHIPLQLVSELPWDSHVSFRKPILFGISTGMTLGSLLLLLDDLQTKPWDGCLRLFLCVSLVIEVLLITVQSWRQVPSHFNRATHLDAIVELAMLLCILFAMALILMLTLRSMKPSAFGAISSARVLAQQAGMLFLAVSCLIGIGITVIGNYQLLAGGSVETLGDKGVLKFPHGAVLHAIQTLVLWSWLCDRLHVVRGKMSIALLSGAHFAFLVYAIRQTWMGKSRWDGDEIAWGLLGVACVFVMSAGAIVLQRKR